MIYQKQNQTNVLSLSNRGSSLCLHGTYTRVGHSCSPSLASCAAVVHRVIRTLVDDDGNNSMDK